MKYLVIFFFYFSISYSQEMESINLETQQVTKLKHGSMNMPKNTALQLANECNQRISENAKDWQAYRLRARSNQVLSKLNLSIEDTYILIENQKLLDFAYWIQGESYVYLLEFEKAIESYKKAVNYYDNPYTIARINFFIGMCYIQIDQEENACMYFEKLGDYRFHVSFKTAKNCCP